jgi:NADPH:quinone reductase-like Zn-dependent oxidoreductase
MKAIRFHEHGGPEVLVFEDAPDPAPAPAGVIVRVRACALNHLDLWQRRGLDRVSLPLPHISGADVAGEIAAVGAGVPDLRPGDRVMLQPGLSCGRCRSCWAGQDNRCPHYDILGHQSAGGYAELVAVPAANLIPLPEAIDFVTAAAFPLTFLTAWHMLVTRARVAESDVVLVVAAGSGVGHAAVQIAKFFGARVIATAGGDAKLEKARQLGADDAIDHYREDVAKQVKQLTAGRGVDIVIDHVGVATWERSVRSLARGGRLVTCGATSSFDATLDLRHLFARQLSLVGTYMGTKADLGHASQLFFRGLLRPVIDHTWPLSEAGHAQRHLEASRQFGKVVLVV